MATQVAHNEELKVETNSFWGGQEAGRSVELSVGGFGGEQVHLTRAQAVEVVAQLAKWLGEGK